MKKIIRINASALKNSHCFRKFWYICIQGFKQSCNTNDIEFGSAFHVFAADMARTKGDLGKSLASSRGYFQDIKMLMHPKKRYLDDVKLCGVTTQWWINKQQRDDFEILNEAVEVTFSNKFYEDDKYIILLEGTIDKIGKFKNGCFAIGDYKTTGSWDADEYFKSHELSCQLRFYLLNLFLAAKLNPDSFLVDICKNPVGAFIEGIFLTSNDVSFKRSRIFFFKKEEMDIFETMLNDFIQRVIKTYESIQDNEYSFPEGILNGSCGGGFKLCQFYAVCNAPNAIARQHVLNNNFVRTEYLPIKMKDE